ncbi:endoribonuclease Dicer-like [Branchiostoma floridae]|uniref:ribonuclease III n=1 Tax=Branchiostoma floridae TaxID=7739 RepID=A0A9J7L750_BRAFL|nr:endoribonuclease Dicer-like [Branchiostoma floridae]
MSDNLTEGGGGEGAGLPASMAPAPAQHTSQPQTCHLQREPQHLSIFTPRLYQMELLDAALEKNTIVCLGTGSGKTFVAVMLIKELSSQTRAALSDGGKRTFFLVNNVPLVSQQAAVITTHTNLSIGEYVGAMGVDLWTRDRWQQEFDTHHVLVMTAQIFLDILQHGFLPLSKVNLLIIDECHHAVGHHPYREIMKTFDTCQVQDYPRVLGLTASILQGKCAPDSLFQRVRNLEVTLRSSAETATDLVGVDRYTTQPNEVVIESGPAQNEPGLSQALQTLVDDALAFISSCKVRVSVEEGERDPCQVPKQAIQECRAILEVLGTWATRRAAILINRELEKLIKHEWSEQHQLFLRWVHTVMHHVHLLCDEAFKDVEDVDVQFVTPKVRRLLEVLRECKPNEVQSDVQSNGLGVPEAPRNGPRGYKGTNNARNGPQNSKSVSNMNSKNHYHSSRRRDNLDNQDPNTSFQLCGIVFVERRYTAVVLNKLLQEFAKSDPDLAYISSSCITGHGLSSRGMRSRETEMAFRRQEEILRRFRMHENNLLIGTSVVEEGVDVPKCNLVVRFDLPKDYRSYVQSKGRARAQGSHYVMLVQQHELDSFKEDLVQFKGIEKILRQKWAEHEVPKEEEIWEHLCDDMVPPYMPRQVDGGPRVTMTSAIGLVNRYCSKLPSDVFTHLTPKSRVDSVSDADGNKYMATLYLPINSSLRDPIQGPVMPTRRLAEKAVALKACQLLHQAGELDDNLLPVGKEVIHYEEEEEEFEVEDSDGHARPGTTKRHQVYKKQIPKAFQQSLPVPAASCYLYIIDMVLTEPLPEELNIRGRKLHPPEATTRCFGLLTSKHVPQIPCFPVYTRSGEVSISLRLCASGINVNQNQLRLVQNFHGYVFSHVLRLEKKPLYYVPADLQSWYFVVPLNKGLLADNADQLFIDFNFLEHIDQSLDKEKPKYSHDNPFKFQEADFIDAVVTPSYRNADQPQRFYVAEICYTLNPRSEFPSADYATFDEYYLKRYGEAITNLDQPLLDVDHTSSRLNLLTPRHLNQKGKALPTSSAETRKAKRENLQSKQILVPELCEIHPVPASLWRKAVCLPSVLYRVTTLLIAEELRVQIAQEAGIGQAVLPEGYAHPRLEFPHLKKVEEVFEPCEPAPARSEKSRTTLEDKEEESWFEISAWNPDDVDDDDEMEDEFGDRWDISEEEWRAFQDNVMLLDTPLVPALDKKGQGQNGAKVNHTNRLDLNDLDLSKASLLDDDFPILTVPGENLPPAGDRLSKASMSNGQIWPEEGRKGEQPVHNGQVKPDRSIAPGNNATSGNGISGEGTSPLSNMPDLNSVPESTSFLEPMLDLDLDSHPGPSPSLILQALTLSNAGDFFNLERLETIGDSFLKHAITTFLYCTYSRVHEGKLSYMRSRQVSNLNLYRLGKRKGLASRMVASIFDPAVNWLPPGFCIQNNREDKEDAGSSSKDSSLDVEPGGNGMTTSKNPIAQVTGYDVTPLKASVLVNGDATKRLLSYDLHMEHCIADKSIADCVEALLGCYLTTCGPRAAQLFLCWLGVKVLPKTNADPTEDLDQFDFAEPDTDPFDDLSGLDSSYEDWDQNPSTVCDLDTFMKVSCAEEYGYIAPPKPPLFHHVAHAQDKLSHMLSGYQQFEETVQYNFNDKAYMLQAFTHPSYHYNTITDCYQRLEFLGDAVLDYLITNHLFKDPQQHSPGALTDLRSALVNNTIFASLAVKYDYHKYLKFVSPELFNIISNFVQFQQEQGEEQGMDSQLKTYINDEGEEESEDIEVPKALGDVFESVAGAIYLDSGMSLETVWRVYYRMMKPLIDKFSAKVPRSPVRELLEMEPETAKFSPSERTYDGKVRVTVTVIGKGQFKGVGRNYRIAKSAAARKALRALKGAKI